MSVLPASSPGSEFDRFLYAPIALNSHGVLQSVLSALARQDLDPWLEAAALTRLPAQIAAQKLCAVITALPEVPGTSHDPHAIAVRLIALLPSRSRADAQGPQQTSAPGAPKSPGKSVNQLLIIVACVALALLGEWLTSATPTPAQADSASAATSTAQKSEP